MAAEQHSQFRCVSKGVAVQKQLYAGLDRICKLCLQRNGSQCTGWHAHYPIMCLMLSVLHRLD